MDDMDKNRQLRARTKSAPRAPSLERDLLTRLGKAEGQLRGVQKMVGANTYCIDLLRQISAVRRALDKCALLLIRDHLGSCVTEAVVKKDAGGIVDELVRTLDEFLT